MLKTNEILEKIGLEEKYHAMIKQINIPDFYKCISAFADIKIVDLKDEVIIDYIKTWAENKYKFFELLGNNIRKDIDFEYEQAPDDLKSKYNEIGRQFPAYGPWLDQMKVFPSNKIEKLYSYWSFSDWCNDYLNEATNIAGSSITHFLKAYLKAPDELVTAVGRLYENTKIKATYTLSIDPVDMMLASENPYNWTSCYRLELREDSHADGCMAAVLDTSSIITYVWNNEGKFTLYDTYKFTSIRYKRMRRWLSISPSLKSVHFNAIYPGKSDYKEDFDKSLREMVEKEIADYLGKDNKWKRNTNVMCIRTYFYGYGEFRREIYSLNEGDKLETENWNVYDVQIPCPCGCGNMLLASDDDEVEYNGDGFQYENAYQEPYCEIGDCRCCNGDDVCEYNCSECSCYRREHPLCELDDEECEYPDDDYGYEDGGRQEACDGHCENCPRWEEHQRVLAEEAREEE